MTEDDLDSLFAAARAAPERPPATLTARVLADAAAEVPRNSAAAPLQSARPGFFARLGAVFGGGGALAGMVTATLAGFWIGFAQPADLGLLLSQDNAQIDLMPGIDALLDEAP